MCCGLCADGLGHTVEDSDLKDSENWFNWRRASGRLGRVEENGRGRRLWGCGYLDVRYWMKFQSYVTGGHAQASRRRKARWRKRTHLPKSFGMCLRFLCFLLLTYKTGVCNYVEECLYQPGSDVKSKDLLPFPLIPLRREVRISREFDSAIIAAGPDDILGLNLAILGVNYLGARKHELVTPNCPLRCNAAQEKTLATLLSSVELGHKAWSTVWRQCSDHPLQDLTKTELDYNGGDGGSRSFDLKCDRVDMPTMSGRVNLKGKLGRIGRFFSLEENIVSASDSFVSDRFFFGSSMKEWILFVARAMKNGLMGVMKFPRKVCGIFCVDKSNGRLRFIFDGRPTNTEHAVSLPIGCCTPSALADMPMPVGGWWLCKSDIVSYFFNLKSWLWMKKWHAMPGVLWRGLKRALGSLAQQVQSLDGGVIGEHETVYPYLDTLPMGYVHSQFLAQHYHQEVIQTRTDLKKSEQLLDGRFRNPVGCERCYGCICDDFFGFLRSQEAAEQLDRQLDHAYRGVGLERHAEKKITGARVGEVAGLEFNGERGFRPSAKKGVRQVRATLQLLARRSCSPWIGSKVTGTWLWLCLMNRPLLSVMDNVFKHAEGHSKIDKFLGLGMCDELLLLCLLFPFMEAKLTSSWDSKVGFTDASEEGFGGCYTHVDDVDELMRLAALSERRGDYVILDGWDLGPTCSSGEKGRRGFPHSIDVRNRVLRFHLAVRWKQEGEHINKLELGAVCLHTRWLTRTAANVGRRHLLLVDSKVALHCLARGRSSAK